LPHAAAKATEAAAPEATKAATTASTRCMAGTPTYGCACGKLAQRIPEGEPMIDVRRRQFITLLGGATAWPLAARAQQPAMPVIGWLGPTEGNDRLLTVFRKGLAEAGYVEGRNVAIEYRWAEGRYDRMPAMAAELLRRPVAMIMASPTPAALVAKAATATVPIVFGVTDDPVKLGLVTSLARPEGNATGVYFFLSDLAGKQLGLLRELVPAAKRIGLLVNPDNANAGAVTQEMAAAASTIGVKIELMRASDIPAIHTAVAALVRDKADALVVGADPFFFSRRVQLVTLTTRHAIPTVFTVRDFPEAGGLMSYGTSLTEAFRQMGVYSGRILKGAKPADLPVVQSTKFDFIINLTTARALGIEVSPMLLARADEVIE
jgi:putative ABC transport system substrate-binding protein